MRAGFLDELMELLTPEAAAACHHSVRPRGPGAGRLAGPGGLAGRPSRPGRGTGPRPRETSALLSALAGQPAHRRVLEGTAAALQVARAAACAAPRSANTTGCSRTATPCSTSPKSFPPDYRFSASQLETYIACPFQFFCKYVLKLEPAERRDEIDEDYTERGSRIHNILQQLEEMKQQIRDQSHEELARIAVGAELNVTLADASEVDLGLAEIERRRLIQTIERYVVQLRGYENDPQCAGDPAPLRGGVRKARIRSMPHLEIGRGQRMVRLQGKIDRIDLVESPEGRGFRVIDYKSGAGPSTDRRPQGAAAPAPAVRHGRRANHPGGPGPLAPRRRLLGAAEGRIQADRVRGVGGRAGSPGIVRRRAGRSAPAGDLRGGLAGRWMRGFLRLSRRSAGSARPGWRPSTTTGPFRRSWQSSGPVGNAEDQGMSYERLRFTLRCSH